MLTVKGGLTVGECAANRWRLARVGNGTFDGLATRIQDRGKFVKHFRASSTNTITNLIFREI